MMTDHILMPGDYFNKNRPDTSLKGEYDAAEATGLFEVILFDYDKWYGEGVLELNREVETPVTTVYRGWMMKPEMYKDFYNSLRKKGIDLVTSPEEYSLMHIFPNIYDIIAEDTAKTLIYSPGSRIYVKDIRGNFKRFMIKDYVKSVKGTDFPRYLNSDITQEELDRYLRLFCKYRGELLTGGICIKEYLDLKKYNGRNNEYRVFYINNIAATVSPNAAQPDYAAIPPEWLINKYSNLPSPFYTIDMCETVTGDWKIIETGDGQVSGLSENQDGEAFFRALYRCFS